MIFYTSQADMFSVSFSQSLANVVQLTAQCHISVPFKATHTIATTQPTTQNNLKQLLLGWYYYQ
jgi:hypothetical protein